MPLLRLSDCSSLSGWDEPNTPEQIARKWFDDFKDSSPSLYECSSSADEIEAVAAFHLTHKNAKRKAYHILRIHSDDLETTGIHPKNDRPGNTGFVTVDFRHWEIPATREQLVALVECILPKIVAGEERLRWIGIRLQEAYWKRFLITPPDRIIEEARRRSRCLLHKHPFPFTAPEQLVRELAEHPLTIPHTRISLEAQREYQERMETGRDGTPLGDWYAAETKLRNLYLQQLIGFTAPQSGPTGEN